MARFDSSDTVVGASGRDEDSVAVQRARAAKGGAESGSHEWPLKIVRRESRTASAHASRADIANDQAQTDGRRQQHSVTGPFKVVRPLSDASVRAKSGTLFPLTLARFLGDRLFVASCLEMMCIYTRD